MQPRHLAPVAVIAAGGLVLLLTLLIDGLWQAEHRPYLLCIAALAFAAALLWWWRVRAQRQVEDELAARNAFLATLLESLPDPVFCKDADGVYIGCNRAFAELNRRTIAGITGLTDRDLAPPEIAEERRRQDLRVLGEGRILHAETRHADVDGTWRSIDTRKAPLRAADGRVVGILGVARDVSERRALEDERARRGEELERLVAERTAELQAANQALLRFKTVIEQNPSAIIIAGADGLISYVNPAFTAQTGYAADEVVGRAPAMLNARGDEAERLAEVHAAAAAGRVWEGEFLNRRKDGSIYWADAIIAPLSDGAGRRTGLVGFTRDITGLKQAREEARQRSEELIQAEKMAALGTLVAGVAHEISNPANFISLNAPLIHGFWDAAQPVLDAHAAREPGFALSGLPYAQVRGIMPELLSGMEDGTARIRRIIGDLRAFSRPDDDREHGPQDLNQVVKAALVITGHAIGKATRHFSCALATGLPPVRGSFQRLEQVVVNLLLNACQAQSDPGQAITVETMADPARGLVVLTVADQGCGIPPEHLRRLGEPFFTTKRGRGGTGLGLSVSQRIVADHHGELRFDSTPGQGTRVLVLLPAA